MVIQLCHSWVIQVLDEYAQKALFRFLRLTIEQQQSNLKGVLSTLSDYEDGLVSQPKTEKQEANAKNMYHQ